MRILKKRFAHKESKGPTVVLWGEAAQLPRVRRLTFSYFGISQNRNMM